METMTKKLRLWGLFIMSGLLCSCTTAPQTPLFIDTTAWPTDAQSVALVGVSFDKSYRPLPQSGLDRELLTQVRRALQAKGYHVLEPERLNRLERKALTLVPASELAGRMTVPADLVVAVHVDYLFSSATYGETDPPPEFEIAAEARLVDAKAERDLWRDRGHALAGGAAAMPLRNPDYDRMRGLAELANDLFLTLPDAGQRPGVSSVE